MPSFKKCKDVDHCDVEAMAKEIIDGVEDHSLLKRLRIDYVFAYGDRDDDGNLIGDAIRSRGLKAHGLCRRVSLKDRVKGHGEAEITLDGDFWEEANEDERRALLDHELTHVQVCLSDGLPKLDRDGRPKIRMRKHDFEFGWFSSIAKRYGAASGERQQAKLILDSAGQLFWPDLVGKSSSRTSKLELHAVGSP